MSRISKFRTLFKGISALVLGGLAALPARADFEYPVSAQENLTKIADRIKTTVDSGVHVVQFRSQYTNLGAFRLDMPASGASRIETLVFEREKLPLIESDEVIRLTTDSALFEIKGIKKGTVILRGLAFQLDHPDARLLAGSETGKENFNLIIDSCFIFGDVINSSFLNWLGAAGSKVEIKRSHFVFRNGSGAALINLSAEQHLLANNLFNFPGQVSASVGGGGNFQAQYNTVNRTQFRLDSKIFQSATYQFARNLIGYKPVVDAFGGLDAYVLWATNFKSTFTLVSENLMYQGWKAFDHEANVLKKWDADPTNRSMDPVSATRPTELWNWYQTGADTAWGHMTGEHRRKEVYNVWPGQDSAKFLILFNEGKASFKPAPYPRQFNYTPVTMSPGIQPPDLRLLLQGEGALHFGPFRVDTIRLKTVAPFGRPVLIAGHQGGKLTPQRSIGAPNASPFHFVNDSASARHFFFSFQGNTPMGKDVIPGTGSSIGSDDLLSFQRVDSAGYTTLKVPDFSAYPDSLRNLGRGMLINTSALVADSVVFGAKLADAKPHLASQVFWWSPQVKAMLPVAVSSDSKYFAKLPASLAALPSGLSVFLVERLNVKRGTTTTFKLTVDSGEVLAGSVGGYQLSIDSLHAPNPLHFGQATRAYKVAYTGRGETDQLVLRLPMGQDAEVFRMGKDSVPTAVPELKADSTRFVSIPIGMGDSVYRVFTGVRFNVIAGQAFNAELNGVTINNLVSATSGRLAVSAFNDSLLNLNGPGGDTLPKNFRSLGGFNLRISYMAVDTATFSAAIKATKAIPTEVEAYAWNGVRWRKLPAPVYPVPADSLNVTISGILKSDRSVAVVEKLRPAEDYVSVAPTVSNRVISVLTKFESDIHRPIDSAALIVHRVNHLGQVEKVGEVKTPIGQTALVDLSNQSGMFQYSVQYFNGSVPYNRPIPTPVLSFNWIPSTLQVPNAAKAENRWHLVGFPYKTGFQASFQQAPVPDTLHDRVGIYKLKTDGTLGWDSLPDRNAVQMQAGDAFLMNATVSHTYQVDTKADFVDETAKVLSAGGSGSGWRFLSTPYPINFLPGNVVSSQGTANPFLELVVSPAPASSGQAREYKWAPVTDRLRAFEGYAYNYRPGETLTFNPWTATSAIAAKAKQAAPTETQALKVRLLTEFSPREIELRAGPDAQSLAFLPAPGNGPELRVGGQGGWFSKKVENLQGIDEPVEIRIPYAQRGRLALEKTGSWAGADWQARLLDGVTGRVHDLTSGDEMAWPQGSGEYRLVAGNRAFVEERVGRFKAGIPSGLALSQNFPNPFRKTTSIALDWPSMEGPAALSRKAWIEVFDSRGKRVHRMDLGLIKAGRQVASLDASAWRTGVYTYRLTVENGGRRIRLQKKMLVVP